MNIASTREVFLMNPQPQIMKQFVRTAIRQDIKKVFVVFFIKKFNFQVSQMQKKWSFIVPKIIGNKDFPCLKMNKVGQ